MLGFSCLLSGLQYATVSVISSFTLVNFTVLGLDTIPLVRFILPIGSVMAITKKLSNMSFTISLVTVAHCSHISCRLGSFWTLYGHGYKARCIMLATILLCITNVFLGTSRLFLLFMHCWILELRGKNAPYSRWCRRHLQIITDKISL